MQRLFKELTGDLLIKVEFKFIATYSPKLNLVEYAIHKIRQQVLHHADWKLDLSEFKKRIEVLCNECVFNSEQIINILSHIKSLIDNKVA